MRHAGRSQTIEISVVRAELLCQRPKHPGSAQIQSIQMDEPAVVPVERDQWTKIEQECSIAENSSIPELEFIVIENSGHEPQLAERRREKILTGWLEMNRQ